MVSVDSSPCPLFHVCPLRISSLGEDGLAKDKRLDKELMS